MKEVNIIESHRFYKGKELTNESFKNNELNYTVDKVLGLDCPNKFLVSINGKMVCFVNSRNSANRVLSYAYDKNSTELEDKKIKRIINSILNR